METGYLSPCKLRSVFLQLIDFWLDLKVRVENSKELSSSSFELDVELCSVSVIPLQHKSCSVCLSFVLKLYLPNH